MKRSRRFAQAKRRYKHDRNDFIVREFLKRICEFAGYAGRVRGTFKLTTTAIAPLDENGNRIGDWMRL